MVIEDDLIVLSKSETKVFLALANNHPLTMHDIARQFPTNARHPDKDDPSKTRLVNERPTLSTIRAALKKFRKLKLVKRRGEWRKCQIVEHTVVWRDYETAIRLNGNATYSAAEGLHGVIRPSLLENSGESST